MVSHDEIRLRIRGRCPDYQHSRKGQVACGAILCRVEAAIVSRVQHGGLPGARLQHASQGREYGRRDVVNADPADIGIREIPFFLLVLPLERRGTQAIGALGNVDAATKGIGER